MASSFETDFQASSWPVLKSFHGESVAIAPAGSGSTSVTALVQRGSVLAGFYPDQTQQRSYAVVLVLPSDVAGWTPGTTEKTGDTVTFDGVVHAVEGIENRPGGLVALQAMAASLAKTGGDQSAPKR